MNIPKTKIDPIKIRKLIGVNVISMDSSVLFNAKNKVINNANPMIEDTTP
jgi:hypothetical protein